MPILRQTSIPFQQREALFVPRQASNDIYPGSDFRATTPESISGSGKSITVPTLPPPLGSTPPDIQRWESTATSLPSQGTSLIQHPPGMAVPAEYEISTHDLTVPPALPTRGTTPNQSNQGSTSTKQQLHHQSKPSHSTPILRGPPSASQPIPPRLPERARGQSISRIGEPRAGAGTPRLPTRTPTIGSSSPRSSLASPTRPSTRSGSSQSTQDPTNGYIPPPPPVHTAISGGVSSPPSRQESRHGSHTGDDSKQNNLSSDEEDEAEPAPGPGISSVARRMLDEYPDSTHTNRRPPAFKPDIRINSMHHVNAFAVFGRYVCTGAHHVRIYDTLISDKPIFTVDLKDVDLEHRLKEPRVTAMCFRPVMNSADQGRYLWCGTKDGHLWELDIKSGIVTDTRAFVHASPVAYIFRHRRAILTLDEVGKLHVFEFSSGVTGDGIEGRPDLTRSLRITDKYSFAKMILGKLWTSSAPANRSTTNTASRGAAIRVFEPCASGGMPPGKTVFTSEWTGAVTSATILPLKPDEVYLGHEGGYVSIWSSENLNCLQTLKISSTDILALEGVGQRLWAGNRKGQIHVYDVSQIPWRTTNTWIAHP